MLEERQRRRLIRKAQPDVSKDCGPGTVRHHVVHPSSADKPPDR